MSLSVFDFVNQVARARGVDCIVAPYEADAQLAFLTKSGLAQAVITEDSDLLAFGCKKVMCPGPVLLSALTSTDILFLQYH